LKQRFVLLGMLTSFMLALVTGLVSLRVAPATAAPQAITVGITSPVQGSMQTSSSFTVTGTSTPGATLQLVVDGGAPINVTATASGAWSHTLTGLTQGPHTVRVDGTRSQPSLLYWASLQNSAVDDLVYVTDPTISGTPIATIPVEQDAVGVTAAADGSKVYISTETGLEVIDTVTNMVVRHIPLGGFTHLGSLTPDGRELWVAQRDFSRVARIDIATDAVLGFIQLDTALKPHDVTFRPDGRYAYTGNTQSESNNISVIDVPSRTVVSTITTGNNNRRVLVNAAGTRLYVAANGAGRVEVFNPQTQPPTPIASVIFGSVEDIVLSVDQSRLYVSSPDAPAIQVLDTATTTRIAGETISGGMVDVRDLAIDPWVDSGIIFGGSATFGDVYDLATRSAVPGRRTDTPNGFRIYDSDWARRLETATATVSFTVNTTSDLVLTKSHPGSFTVGQPGVYTIAVTNAGPAPASLPLTITDILPAGLVPTAATFPGGSCTTAGQTVTCVRTSGVVLAGMTITATITVDVTPAAAGNVVNRACVAIANESAPTSNCDDDPTVVIPVANLAIEKTSDPFFVVGQTGVYSLTVTNLGPSPASGPITVTDTLPAGLTYQAATGAPCTVAGQVVTCARAGALAVGSSFAIRLTVLVSPTAAGTRVNSACVAGSTLDPVSANDCATVTTPVLMPGVTIHKSATPPDGFFVSAHDLITYTLDVTNTGSLTLTNVRVSDAIPLGTTYLAGSARPALNQGPSPAVWSVPTLPPGQHLQVSFTVRVAAIGTTTEIRNVATVGSTETPPTPSNEVVHPFDPTAVELMAFTAERDNQAITVRWETARELDTASFAIWFGLTPDRTDAIRQTQTLIPATGNATTGAVYTQRLTSPFWLRQARIYVWLEETDTAAKTAQYGPVALARFPIFIPLVRR
jgi:uncharacterized repeat protein (TIGR01451 family)